MYLLQKPCPSSGLCCKQELVTARLLTTTSIYSQVKPGHWPLLVALVAALDQDLLSLFWPLLPANQRTEFRKGESHQHASDSPTILLLPLI